MSKVSSTRTVIPVAEESRGPSGSSFTVNSQSTSSTSNVVGSTDSCIPSVVAFRGPSGSILTASCCWVVSSRLSGS
ncbi:ORF32 [Fowl aviadenovirus E]|uniref:ORF32 n=1 Tax=Fowl aviadenovirus E TaxID=190065 RepID=A0A1D8DE08_9ADEN|nr:ORF32 [Fowl aviadenovirus E]